MAYSINTIETPHDGNKYNIRDHSDVYLSVASSSATHQILFQTMGYYLMAFFTSMGSGYGLITVRVGGTASAIDIKRIEVLDDPGGLTFQKNSNFNDVLNVSFKDGTARPLSGVRIISLYVSGGEWAAPKISAG